jgi:glycosyltransferase involved in cell wall biosynthesis
MKAAIVNPYLDTLGGGERYTLAVAEALAQNGFSVDIEWKDKKITALLEKRFGKKLNEGISFLPDVNRGDGYDVCFWVSDGSIPTLRARKNILHFQVPFHHVGGNSLLNKMKFFRIDEIVCNSLFTKNVIDHEYGVESKVIYPPVDVGGIKPKRKEDIILSVGRFSSLMQSKNQDVLVKAFKKMNLDGWRLILAGGIEVGADEYVKKVEKLAYGSNIEIIKSSKFKDLKDLYGKAKIFWSASGFGQDEEKNPNLVEHFGITVVEAMAAGVVPVVYKAGGHKEIVKDGKTGLLWDNEGQLIRFTRRLIDDQKSMRQLSKTAHDSSRIYGYERFIQEVLALL